MKNTFLNIFYASRMFRLFIIFMVIFLPVNWYGKINLNIIAFITSFLGFWSAFSLFNALKRQNYDFSKKSYVYIAMVFYLLLGIIPFFVNFFILFFTMGGLILGMLYQLTAMKRRFLFYDVLMVCLYSLFYPILVSCSLLELPLDKGVLLGLMISLVGFFYLNLRAFNNYSLDRKENLLSIATVLSTTKAKTVSYLFILLGVTTVALSGYILELTICWYTIVLFFIIVFISVLLAVLLRKNNYPYVHRLTLVNLGLYILLLSVGKQIYSLGLIISIGLLFIITLNNLFSKDF